MKVNCLSGGHVHSHLDSSVALNGHIATGSNMNSGLGGQGTVRTTNGILPMEPRYPHIKDLQARAKAETSESLLLTPVSIFLVNSHRCLIPDSSRNLTLTLNLYHRFEHFWVAPKSL